MSRILVQNIESINTYCMSFCTGSLVGWGELQLSSIQRLPRGALHPLEMTEGRVVVGGCECPLMPGGEGGSLSCSAWMLGTVGYNKEISCQECFFSHLRNTVKCEHVLQSPRIMLLKFCSLDLSPKNFYTIQALYFLSNKINKNR